VSLVIGGLLTELVAPDAEALSVAVVARTVAPGRVSLAAGQTVEFSGWLDALPLGYWARFTTVRTVRLEVTSSAPVDITVRVSDARAVCRDITSGRTREGRFSATVDTAEAAEGGWSWPVITAAFDTAATEVAEVHWQWVTDDVVPQPNSLAVAITTFDRQAACLRQLGALAAAGQAGGALDGVLGRVILVDQGTMAVAESAGFSAVQDSLGERLTVIRQQNLGASGGVSRGLHEGLKDSSITHVALLDDDALAQPEGLAHAWAFAQAAHRPTLVGGHIFDAAAPTTLHRLGEVVDRMRFTRTSLPGTPMNTDLAHASVSDHAWLGPAYSVDFQPWRMCLVPRAVVEAIGLPMPFFLEWDDVEFGLRATAAGFVSVVLPGTVAWHESRVGKNADSGRQDYFLVRNRIVTALLHDARPTALFAEWLAVSLRHLAQREPAEAAIRWAALKDVLHGPGWLHRDLGTARERAAETARREIVAPHPVSAVTGSVTASARLGRRWLDLGAQYRAAVPEATSTRRWVQTFTAAAVLERRSPTWSIVVTSFHSLDMLTKHWHGLIEAGEMAGVPAQDVEVIVVDNADEPEPEVEAFAREQGFAYLPMGSNVGLSAANNRGAEVATGDYLLFANPDLGVLVADLSILKAEIDRTGGIVAPRVDFADGTPQSAARGEPYFFAKLAHRGLAPKAALDRYLWPVGPYESGPVVWCAGGATSLSREVFDRIGGWPEEYFLYMEDVELGVRAGGLGIPVSVTAELRWVHEWRGDSRQRFTRGQFLHLRSAVRFYLRYPKYLGWPR
jgi:galactofuranosylgalactofuranosylrhamnosyl-N-acetylglucosaminyl-diphospho-decaprenol beta-1,5/1,6-galactofuranosyltransferase